MAFVTLSLIVTAIIFHRCNFSSTHIYIYIHLPASFSLSFVRSFVLDCPNKSLTLFGCLIFCMCYRAIVASTLLAYTIFTAATPMHAMFQIQICTRFILRFWHLSQHSTFAQAHSTPKLSACFVSVAVIVKSTSILAAGLCQLSDEHSCLLNSFGLLLSKCISLACVFVCLCCDKLYARCS